jgi:uncharacterized protein (DUF1697 family)
MRAVQCRDARGAGVGQDVRVPEYVAFLRAINLGKNRKFPMVELRACLEAAGFQDVATYIQTGNVRLRSPMRLGARVEQRLEQVFEEDRGFAVPTIVLTPTELRQTYVDAVGLDVSAARRYVTLLKDKPSPGTTAAIDAWDRPGEGAKVIGRAVHWWLDQPVGQSVFSNATVERSLGVATTRDLKVITTLAERWGS